MSLAIVTSPENALSSLSDLIDEVRDEMDDDAFSASKINRAIARAEAEFNRVLRVPKMETETQIAVTNEATSLPADFLEMRFIYQEGEPDSPLRQMSPEALRKEYVGAAGVPSSFALDNRRIIIAPVGDTTLTLIYFARIPSLTDSNPSNWLLDEHPDLYLHKVLAILYNRQGDSERAIINESKAGDIIAQIQSAGVQSRYGGSSLVPRGMTQSYVNRF